MIGQHQLDLARYRTNKAKETGEITIIATGPLTNIARAIQKDPVSMAKAKEIVFMGGAVNVSGNIPPLLRWKG